VVVVVVVVAVVVVVVVVVVVTLERPSHRVAEPMPSRNSRCVQSGDTWTVDDGEYDGDGGGGGGWGDAATADRASKSTCAVISHWPGLRCMRDYE
jgi:hypothetical protein